MKDQYGEISSEFLYLPAHIAKGAPDVRLEAALGPGVEDARLRVGGYWRDIVRNADGSLRDVSEWRTNLVVNDFAVLVALLVLGNGAGAANASFVGVQYMAVGTGASGWDSVLPPPQLTDHVLTAESYRVAVTTTMVSGNSPSTYTVVAPPYTSGNWTGQIQCTATFGLNQANTTDPAGLREWGLFGGNATATLGSGIMIDHVTTAKLPKPSGADDFILTRIVTLVF